MSTQLSLDDSSTVMDLDMDSSHVLAGYNVKTVYYENLEANPELRDTLKVPQVDPFIQYMLTAPEQEMLLYFDDCKKYLLVQRSVMMKLFDVSKTEDLMEACKRLFGSHLNSYAELTPQQIFNRDLFLTEEVKPYLEGNAPHLLDIPHDRHVFEQGKGNKRKESTGLDHLAQSVEIVKRHCGDD